MRRLKMNQVQKYERHEISKKMHYSSMKSLLIQTYLYTYGSNLRLSSEQVGRTECSFVCHVPGP
jgi:hypothetical protein